MDFSNINLKNISSNPYSLQENIFGYKEMRLTFIMDNNFEGRDPEVDLWDDGKLDKEETFMSIITGKDFNI
jgi:hypothetical protein